MSDPFSDANVKAFAAAWYLALDQHAPTATCEALLVEQGLRMIFPEKTLHGLGDFAAWYAGGTYGDGDKAPGVINLFFDESHTVLSVVAERDANGAVVDVIVGWQASWFVAPEARARRTSMNATQRWTIVAAPGRNPFGIAIASYDAMAKPFEYAPGFARL
jgi:hypothetical protein